MLHCVAVCCSVAACCISWQVAHAIPHLRCLPRVNCTVCVSRVSDEWHVPCVGDTCHVCVYLQKSPVDTWHRSGVSDMCKSCVSDECVSVCVSDKCVSVCVSDKCVSVCVSDECVSVCVSDKCVSVCVSDVCVSVCWPEIFKIT